ncbi:general substrate transporter [Thelonectria olida]|uniref:General substrate transporter n=1 Tax=Thelonectria olida TaxID=1576542 RepID=A0A9P9ARQ7_9HYPO|nr:general substrate transporter [Thelonectria olida]
MASQGAISAAKDGGHPTEPQVSGHEFADLKGEAVVESDRQAEHDLTLKQVFANHPALAWWSFYWAMAGVGWGFDAQINGAMISVEAFRRDFGYVQDGTAILPADWQSAFNIVSSVGQFFGGFFCSWISDRIGRKQSLLIGLCITTGGIFGEIFSNSNAAFVVSKLILGLGLGFYLTLAPLATSEIAPVVLRGMSTTGVNLGIAVGQLISNGVVKGFGERLDHWAYRAPFATQFFFVLFLAVGLPFVPETPWYLARKGKRDEARESLLKLYGKNVDVNAKLATLEETIAEEDSSRAEEPSWAQCFKGVDLTRTLISIGVFVCQHFVGIVFVLGYSTYFFQLAGLPESRSFDLGVGVTACGVAGNICSWFVVNSFGRRKIFLTGMVALTTLLILIGIMDVIPTSAAKWVQSACTVIYAFVYFATVGAMAFAILGEASSTALKAKTMALATATQAVMGIIMNFAIPYMVNPDEGNLKGKVGFVFGGLAAIAGVWSFFYVPELKGRRYDEIDRLFQLKVNPRQMGTYQL